MALDFWQDNCIADFKITDIEGNHFSCIVAARYESHSSGLFFYAEK